MNSICGYSLDENTGEIHLCTRRSGHKDNINRREDECKHEKDSKSDKRLNKLIKLRNIVYKSVEVIHNVKQEAFKNIYSRYRSDEIKNYLVFYILSTKRLNWSIERRLNYIESLTDNRTSFYQNEEFLKRVETLFEGFMKHEQKQHGEFAFAFD